MLCACRGSLKALAVAASAIALPVLLAQTSAPAAHNLPNPYHAVENWAHLPAGIQWAQVISVDLDGHGNVWVFHRSEPNILEFDGSGNLLKSFGGGFVQAHGMTIDRENNVWVTDAQGKDGKGQQVFKFSPEGKILLTLGKAGVAGTGPDTFNGPADVVIGANGDIFVADGHYGDNTGRVVKFSKGGKFLKEWGKRGSGPGEFDEPHGIAMDSKGHIFVADRKNNRIQIFDQDGRFLEQWKQFGRPSGIFISRDDTLYSVDSQSDQKTNPGVKRGIRIGSARDGSVKAFIPDLETNPQIALAEGVAADAKGGVYAAGVSSMALHKFVRK
jgi:DNA-binding beta-propeller fold protein YncE